ncbi:MAG TPA: amidase [Methylomirabilota bacterium]|jgi:Asp-tRNA(Asn)/Glu-tRNA(Gln) amidotransferase A subunit family amidase|nr:amidase [Methylomirabilota bacterium]
MSGLSDLERFDGLGLAELVRRRQVTPQELLDATVARIEKKNPALNAVVTRMYDQAQAAVRTGLPAGPFTGAPYLLKDLGALYTGVVTSFGGKFFADNVADHDSEIVARMKRAGLVIVGKSNTPEMGLAPSTEPRLFGPTRNPWALEHSAGGSSGGAAAAVASGMLPMAHATDGGGSIRIPASCCGLFGLKPTRARNPMGPDAGEGWGGASVAHAVTWSVRDSAALLDATSGPDVGDPYWAPPPARPFLDEVGRDPGRLRIALSLTPWNGVPVDSECADAARAAARLCAGLGHDVEEARPQIDEGAWSYATRVIVAANVTANLEARAAALGRPLAEADVERMTWSRVMDARTMSAADYARSANVVHRVGRVVARFLERYDVILTPTMCQPPQRLGVLDMSTTDDAGYLAAVLASIGFTSLFNSSGNPAMSVPLATSGSGLPLGVQFAARFGDEATLFRLGAQLEAAQPWAGRRPAV